MPTLEKMLETKHRLQEIIINPPPGTTQAELDEVKNLYYKLAKYLENFK